MWGYDAHSRQLPHLLTLYASYTSLPHASHARSVCTQNLRFGWGGKRQMRYAMTATRCPEPGGKPGRKPGGKPGRKPGPQVNPDS